MKTKERLDLEPQKHVFSSNEVKLVICFFAGNVIILCGIFKKITFGGNGRI